MSDAVIRAVGVESNVERATSDRAVDTSAPETCRMFETPLIERFSRVHPAAPFVFWVPVLVYFGVRAVHNQIAWAAMPFLVIAGMLVWSLTEYVLHRYVFHRIGPSPLARRMYFILHGVHHDFPQDATRLVMPLGVSIPMGLASYLLLRLAFGPTLVDPVFVGYGIGYLAYDGIHYAVHHFRMTSRLGKYLKRHHMVHHHTGESARWGVSSPLWDWVFRTMGR